MSARSCGFSWRLSVSCCSSPAGTLRTCSWCERKDAIRNWRYVPRSERAVAASRGRCCRKAWCLRSRAVRLGVALAQAATMLLQRIAPAELPRLDEIGIDVTVLLFTLGVSVLSGALFGLFAVLRFGSPSMMSVKEGGRSTSDAPGRHRTRNALVVGQVALALTLLLVSGLMIRTFIAMRQVDPGFTRPEEVQTFVIAIPEDLIRDPQQAARTFESVAERLARCRASPRLASRPPSRWTAKTTAIRSRWRARRCRTAAAPAALQELCAGIFRDDGQPAGRRALNHLERHSRATASHRHFCGARHAKLWRDPSTAIGKRVRGQRPRRPGARSSAWSAMSATMG